MTGFSAISKLAITDGNGARTMFITSTVSSPDFGVSIQAQDGGLLFLQPNNQVGFSVAACAE